MHKCKHSTGTSIFEPLEYRHFFVRTQSKIVRVWVIRLYDYKVYRNYVKHTTQAGSPLISTHHVNECKQSRSTSSKWMLHTGGGWGGIVKRYGCTAIHNKVLFNASFIHSLWGAREGEAVSGETCGVVHLHLHLADAFIQSDLHSGYTFLISMRVPWESNPQPFVLLTQCSTTEPHRILYNEISTL